MTTPSDVIKKLEQCIKTEFNSNLQIKGEIDNWSLSRGHAYFSIKDEHTSISCVIWKSSLGSVSFPVKNGT